jgi:hypothetical protein
MGFPSTGVRPAARQYPPGHSAAPGRPEGGGISRDRPTREAESRRRQETGRVRERIGVGATGDDVRLRGGSDGQATAHGGQELDSS